MPKPREKIVGAMVDRATGKIHLWAALPPSWSIIHLEMVVADFLAREDKTTWAVLEGWHAGRKSVDFKTSARIVLEGTFEAVDVTLENIEAAYQAKQISADAADHAKPLLEYEPPDRPKGK